MENLRYEAFKFAFQKHKGQYRKSSDIHYITHCVEAAEIADSLANQLKLSEHEADLVVAAALLHDTVEDTDTTFEELREFFEEDLVNLVKTQTEDKSKTWQERKDATITFLKENKDPLPEIVTLSDKLSNLKSINKDFDLLGNKVWNKFNSPKEKQEWYYTSIINSMKFVLDTEEYLDYRENLSVFKKES